MVADSELTLAQLQTDWYILLRIGYGSVKTEPKKFIFEFRQTPTTILVAVIKAYRNRKTNLNAKTNRNPHLQKTCKKKLKEKRKKNYKTHGGIRTLELLTQ